jgi:phosphoribosylaminoimidazole-succinocarboxamide synthase
MKMGLNFSTMQKVAEGKTKIIYANPEDERTVYMYFKDDITAGDGVKHDVIKGKAVIDWQINRDIFEYLTRAGVRSHYIASPDERVVLVKKLDRKIELEVVTRRVATGSIVKWGKATEGTRYDPVITQFHYKDDPLHDPMLDEMYINYIITSKGANEFQLMRETNAQIFLLLEHAFAQFDIQLIDFKLEYGLIAGEPYLIDEITGGSFRLWPYARPNPHLNQENILQELDPQGRLDKDLYRMGEATTMVKSKFAEIASITAKFKDIKL